MEKHTLSLSLGCHLTKDLEFERLQYIFGSSGICYCRGHNNGNPIVQLDMWEIKQETSTGQIIQICKMVPQISCCRMLYEQYMYSYFVFVFVLVLVFMFFLLLLLLFLMLLLLLLLFLQVLQSISAFDMYFGRIANLILLVSSDLRGANWDLPGVIKTREGGKS